MSYTKTFIIISLTIPIVSVFYSIIYTINEAKISEESFLDVTERIRNCGYEAEKHVATTKDGFDLYLHRVRPQIWDPDRKPILILLGMTCTTDILILNKSEHSLPFILSRSNYDVWIGNYRGTIQSRPNPNFNHTLTEQRQFGYHELGVYDVPAIIDYILSYTQKEQLTTVAISLGNTVLMIALSEYPEYNNKIDKAIFLAPITPCFERGNWVQQYWLPFCRIKIYRDGFTALEHYLFFNARQRAIAAYVFCHNPILKHICKASIAAVAGNNYTADDDFNTELFQYMPGGYMQGLHVQYDRGCLDDKFLKPDYGPEENLRVYGQTVPSEYNTTLFTTPVIAYYVTYDSVQSSRCTLRTLSKIPNLKKVRAIRQPFSHGQLFLSPGKHANFIHNLLTDLPRKYN